MDFFRDMLEDLWESLKRMKFWQGLLFMVCLQLVIVLLAFLFLK